MTHTQNDRGQIKAEAERLLADARAAHRTADRERARARKLAGRIARRLQHTLASARAQLDADRQALDARTARFNQAQSDFHTAAATERDRLRDAWADLAARQTRLAEEWDETNRFHADQAATLDARAAELAARAKADADAKGKLQREVASLREEAAALDAQARNARQVVDELERRREELRAEALAPVVTNAEPPLELQVALDRSADRDLTRWANELALKEERLKAERASVAVVLEVATREREAHVDRRRLLAEQFAQLAAARAGWQEAESATVAEMEHLARTLRQREAELDAREQRTIRADARRRDDAHELWRLRLRLEAWQTKLVAFGTRWHTERERLDAVLARREAALLAGEAQVAAVPDDGIPFGSVVFDDAPPAVPAELAALRDEVERMAVVLLETDLPERPDGELPWAAPEAEPVPVATEEANVLPFEPVTRAA